MRYVPLVSVAILCLSVCVDRASAEQRVRDDDPLSAAQEQIRALKLQRGGRPEPSGVFLDLSILGDPPRCRRFALDSAWIDFFLSRPDVRHLLSDPAEVRALATNQSLITFFIKTRAMKDPQAVANLAGGPLLSRLLKFQSVQALADDAGFAEAVMSNGDAMAWLKTHPRAKMSLVDHSPALARSIIEWTRHADSGK